MKKKYILISLILVSSLGFSQVFTGASYFSGNNSNYIQDVVTDPSGNIYCTGYFFDQINLGIMNISAGAGNSNGFVMKTDPSGNPLWVVALVSNMTMAMAIERTSDGSIFVGGTFRSKLVIGNDSIVSASPNNAFIAKFSNTGSLVWMKHLPGSAGDSGYNRMNMFDLATDNSGNIYYTGFFTSEISIDGTPLTAVGTNDAFYGKITPSGNSVWIKKCGGTYGGTCGLPNNDSGNSIDLDNSGNIFLAGHFAFNFTIGTLTAPGSSDIEAFIAKLDNAGNPLWVKSVPGLAVQTATGVSADPSGNAILSVRFQLECYINSDTLFSHSSTGSPYDFVIVKYDHSGNILWYRQEGFTGGGDYPEAIVSDNTGNIYLCGNFTSSTQICDSTLTSSPSWADRIFIACYNPLGNPNFVLQCGGEKNYPYAMTLNQNNDLILAGSADIGSTSGIHFGAFTCPGSYGHYPYITTLDNPFSEIETIEISDQNSLSIFPNPSDGKFSIKSDNKLLLMDNTDLEIYNVLGEIIYTVYNFDKQTSNEIDLSNSPKGIYFIKVETEKGSIAKKFIKE